LIIPLKTERLRIEPLTLSDAHDFYTLYQDPEVMRFLPVPP
jgi:RimJ/RimL family protein N-acetyltransferase